MGGKELGLCLGSCRKVDEEEERSERSKCRRTVWSPLMGVDDALHSIGSECCTNTQRALVHRHPSVRLIAHYGSSFILTCTHRTMIPVTRTAFVWRL